MRRAEASGTNEPKVVNSSLVDDLKAFTDQRHLFGGLPADEYTFLHIIVPQLLFQPDECSLSFSLIVGKLSVNLSKRDDVDLDGLDDTDRVMLPVGHNTIVSDSDNRLLFLLQRPQQARRSCFHAA